MITVSQLRAMGGDLPRLPGGGNEQQGSVDAGALLAHAGGMIRVDFDGNAQGQGKSALARPGDALIDISDEVSAPISFSCRSASCGTCRVEVLEGEALLAPASPEEQEVLDIFDAPASQRLACQARLVEGAEEGRVRLRWAGDD
jgi:ferredoxin